MLIPYINKVDSTQMDIFMDGSQEQDLYLVGISVVDPMKTIEIYINAISKNL
jgi:hypothetical protein